MHSKDEKETAARAELPDERGTGADVDRLVDGLRGDDASDQRGFTLARDMALERLREYLLPEAEGYVLLLARAMLQRGASCLRWRVEAEGVVLTCDGTPLTLEDFEGLYDHVVGGDAERAPGLRELALGLHSCLRLKPRQVRVLSATPEPGRAAELLLTPDGDDRYRVVREPGEGTRIHVQQPNRAREQPDDLPEVRLLTEGCQYASVPVVVNGVDVARGLHLGEPAVCVASLADVAKGSGLRGEVGYLPDQSEPQQMRLVLHGVWVDTQDPQVPRIADPVGFVAVIVADNLRMDLSQTHVVEGDGLEAARRAARRGYHKVRHAHRVEPLVTQKRRELVDKPLRDLAAMNLRRVKRTRAVIWTAIALLFGAFLYSTRILDQALSDLWGAAFVVIATVLLTLVRAAIDRLLHGPPTEARFKRQFPPGSVLRDTALQLIEERRENKTEGWHLLQRVDR